MTDYGGGVSNGYNNGAYEITNENVSYRPQLTVGNTLTFSLSAQGSGFVESEFVIELINLDQPVAPPGDPEESLATAVNINDWGSGFIATFECVLPATGTPEIDQFLIDFNYTGGGTPANGWMVSYSGSVESGFIAANKGVFNSVYIVGVIRNGGTRTSRV